MSESIVEPQEAREQETWTSWDNPVLTPEQWQEVRKACEAGMTYGEASEKWQIENATIRKRAQREEWITTTRIKIMAEKIIEKESQDKAEGIKSRAVTSGQDVARVPSNAIQAVAETFESHRSGTLLNLARMAGKGISRAVQADLPIENWQDAKIVADIAMKLHNVGQEGVNVNVLVGGDGGFDGPVVEISDMETDIDELDD